MTNYAFESMYSASEGSPDIQLHPWHDILLPSKEVMEAARTRWIMIKTAGEVTHGAISTSVNAPEGFPSK